MNAIQRIDETPWRWKLFGIVTMLSAFRSTIWGFGVAWGDSVVWIVPPVGLWIGMPNSPWFWPVVIVFAPVLLALGLYAGYVFRTVLYPAEGAEMQRNNDW